MKRKRFPALAKAVSLLFILSLSGTGFSQVDSVLLKRVSSISAGAYMGIQGIDPGLGIDITSPAFLKKSLAVRIHGCVNWLEWSKAETNNYVTYPELGATLVFNTRPSQRMRLFIEAGPFFLFPSKEFSNHSVEAGFSTLAGAEMFVTYGPHFTVSFFFGGGLAICNADAEKLNSRPPYGDGFLFKNGLRCYF